MSYIDKALKQEAEERASGMVVVRPPAPPTGRPRRAWWPWVVVAALVINVAVLAIVLRNEWTVAQARAPVATRATPEETPVRSTPEPVTPARERLASTVAVTPAPNPAPAPAPSPEVQQTGPPRGATTREQAVAPPTPPGPIDKPSARAERRKTLRSADTAGPAAPAQRTPPPKRDERADRARPETTARTTSAADTRAPVLQAQAAPIAPPAPPQRPTVAVPDTPAPRFSLPQTQTSAPAAATVPPARSQPATSGAAPSTPASPAAAPKYRLQALVYSDVTAERMVFINGSKYREGSTIEPDVYVEQITEDGAILRDHGERVVLRESGR